eukprot:8165010-Pyramimonas_sp.AAC.1
MGMYASELSRAQRQGDAALRWKLSRLLAKARKTFLEPPGREGVFLAKSPCQEEEKQRRQNREPKVDLTISTIQHGTGDYIEVRRKMRNTRLRRSPPDWSFLAGVWRLLLWPNEFRYDQSDASVETQEEDDWSFQNINTCLTWICVAIRHHGATPLQWHQNNAFSLSRFNGKSECKGQRLVHSLDSIGKSYYGVLWS